MVCGGPRAGHAAARRTFAQRGTSDTQATETTQISRVASRATPVRTAPAIACESLAIASPGHFCQSTILRGHLRRGEFALETCDANFIASLEKTAERSYSPFQSILLRLEWELLIRGY